MDIDIDKKKYIKKYINILEISSKYELCKKLTFYNLNFESSNNGVYLLFSDLNDTIINIIYDYIKNKIDS
jgi:hypothetical protein